MIIRKAELKDIDELVILTGKFFKESLSDYGLRVEEETIKKTLSHYIKNLIGNKDIACMY